MYMYEEMALPLSLCPSPSTPDPNTELYGYVYMYIPIYSTSSGRAAVQEGLTKAGSKVGRGTLLLRTLLTLFKV